MQRLAYKILSSSSMMLAFSNLARASSFVFPLPILYYYFSAEEVAFWLMLSTIISLQTLFFIGLPTVLVRTISFVSAGGELDRTRTAGNERDSRPQSLRDVCQFFKVAFLVLMLLQLIVFGIAGTLLLLEPISILSNVNDGWIGWAIILSFTVVRAGVLEQLTFLNGMGDVAVPRMLDGILWTVGGLLSAALLWQTKSLAVLAIGVSIPSLISYIILAMRRNRFGWKLYSTGIDWTRMRQTARHIWAPTWRAGLGTLLSNGSRQCSGLLLAQLGLPQATAAYLLAQNVITLITLMSAAPVQAHLHTVSAAHARGDVAVQRDMLAATLFRSMMVSVLLYTAVCALFPIMKVAGYTDIFVTPSAWAVMGLSLLLQRFGAVHLQSYSVTNHIIWHWLDGVTGVLNITISLLLLQITDVWAVVLGNFLSIVLFYFWIPASYSSRMLGLQSPFSFVSSWLWPSAVFAAVTILLVLFG